MYVFMVENIGISVGQLIFILLLLLIFYCAPALTAVADFRMGIKKAKQRGEEISSDGFKRTIDKLTRYYLFIFAITVIDFVQIILIQYVNFYYEKEIILLPFLTAGASIICCLIEVKSIFESNDVKTKKNALEATKLASAIVKLIKDPSALSKLQDLITHGDKQYDKES